MFAMSFLNVHKNTTEGIIGTKISNIVAGAAMQKRTVFTLVTFLCYGFYIDDRFALLSWHLLRGLPDMQAGFQEKFLSLSTLYTASASPQEKISQGEGFAQKMNQPFLIGRSTAVKQHPELEIRSVVDHA
jgi:hypothetical protein